MGRIVLLVASALVVLVGCRENAVDVRQQMVNEVQSGAYDKAVGVADTLYGSGEKDALLWCMERGSIDSARGDEVAATKHFDRASQLVVDRRTESIARKGLTFIANENATEYAGNGYEHILVDYYRSLAAVVAAQRLQRIQVAVDGGGGDLDAVVQKMNNCARGMVMERIQFNKDNAPDLRYFDDPYARVIAACMYLATPPQQRVQDDEGFAFTQLVAACHGYKKQKDVLGAATGLRYEVDGIPTIALQLAVIVGSRYDPEGLARLLADVGVASNDTRIANAIPGADQGLVLVLNHADWITPTDRLDLNLWIGVPTRPTLTEAERQRGVTVTGVRCWMSTCWAKGPGSEIANGWSGALATAAELGAAMGQLPPGTWIGFEMPAHRADVRVPTPGVAIVGGREVRLQVVDDIDAYARVTLKDLQPGLLTKTLTRVALKHVAAGAVQGAARNDAGGNGEKRRAVNLVGAVGHAIASASERADTRYWSQLPDRIEAALAIVPAGEQTVTVMTAAGIVAPSRINVPAGRLVIVPVRTFPDTGANRH